MSYPDVPRSKFERAPRPTEENTAPHASASYFSDAMRRFAKNRAAITAAVLILAVVLFSLLTPLAVGGRTPNSLDAYYAKKPPRLTLGGTKAEFTERGIIATLAIGAGASAQNGTSVPFSEINEEYAPVRSEIKRNGTAFSARIDRYLEVGVV